MAKRKNLLRTFRLKAKYKRLIKHWFLRKRLFKKKTSKRLLRGFFLGTLFACTGSLAYAIAIAKPVIEVGAHKNGQFITLVAPTPTPVPPGAVAQSGRGSWYALGLPQPDALTCASIKFSRGTYLEVTDLNNGNRVTCLVNDYGPEIWTGRVIDLSRGSFSSVDDLGRGTIPVDIRLASGAPSGSVPIPNVLGQLYGYNLCHSQFSPQWCEANRQTPGLVPR